MDPALRAELLTMLEEDQRVRRALAVLAERDEAFRTAWAQRTDPETSEIGVLAWDPGEAPEVVRQMWEADRRHLERLREIVAQHEWPGTSLVGADGAHAAWLLVLHADQDRAFQRHCLDLLTTALAAGDVTPYQVAWLTDRLLMAERREQRYGTILLPSGSGLSPFRLAEPGTVDERRRALGLAPLAEEIRRRSSGAWP